MPLDAPHAGGETAPRPGSIASFRLLTARLRGDPPAGQPPPPHPAPPAAAPVPLADATVSQDAAPAMPAAPEPVAEEPPTESTPVAAPVMLALPAPSAAPLPGEAAASLLDIVWGAVDMPPQERSMAGDGLLLLLPGLPPRQLATLAERISAMDTPPPLLVSRLLRDPRREVSGVLLERSAHLDAADLLAACESADPERLRLIARRRNVPATVTDRLVQTGDLLSLLALLRNPGAQITFAAFLRLVQMTAEHPALQAPLALRSDLPLAVALELFWRLPPELRRVVIARFVSDSVTLGRILAVTLSAGEPGFAAGSVPPPGEIDAALSLLFTRRRQEASARLAHLAFLSETTVERILADEAGEGIVVLLKALGLSRTRFDDVLDQIRAATGLLKQDRPQEELKSVFDSLSFTKARVLLTYWDWFSRKAGPYAPPG